jgi:hypothetical protein
MSAIQSGCRRCGGERLAAQVIAWAEYEMGELRRFSLDDPGQDVRPLPRGYALCLDCMHVQPLIDEEIAA